MVPEVVEGSFLFLTSNDGAPATSPSERETLSGGLLFSTNEAELDKNPCIPGVIEISSTVKRDSGHRRKPGTPAVKPHADVFGRVSYSKGESVDRFNGVVK